MKRVFWLLVFLLGVIDAKAQTVITMEQEGGVYKVPCVVNGMRMKFIFDTGASSVCISKAIAEFMMENGYISKEDIVGKGKSTVADGRIVENLQIILRDIEIAGLHLHNVEAVVILSQDAGLLLGQSAIQRLGSVTISGNRLIIASSADTIDEEYIDDLDRKATSYLKSNNYYAAIAPLEELLKYNRLGAFGYVNLIYCYNYIDNLDKCIFTYNDWKRLFAEQTKWPNNWEAHYYAAQSYYGKYDYHAAISSLRHALTAIEKNGKSMHESSGQYSQTCFLMGCCYQGLKDKSQTKYFFKQAVLSRLDYLDLDWPDYRIKTDETLGKYCCYLAGESDVTSAEWDYYMVSASKMGYKRATDLLIQYGLYSKMVRDHEALIKSYPYGYKRAK